MKVKDRNDRTTLPRTEACHPGPGQALVAFAAAVVPATALADAQIPLRQAISGQYHEPDAAALVAAATELTQSVAVPGPAPEAPRAATSPPRYHPESRLPEQTDVSKSRPASEPRSARRAPPKPASRPERSTRPRAPRARRAVEAAAPRPSEPSVTPVVSDEPAEPTEPVAPEEPVAPGALVTPQEAVASMSQGGAVPPDEPVVPDVLGAPEEPVASPAPEAPVPHDATVAQDPVAPAPDSVPGPAVLDAGPPVVREAVVTDGVPELPALDVVADGILQVPAGAAAPEDEADASDVPAVLARPSPASPGGSGTSTCPSASSARATTGRSPRSCRAAPRPPLPPPSRRPRRGSGTGPGTVPRAATRGPPATRAPGRSRRLDLELDLDAAEPRTDAPEGDALLGLELPDLAALPGMDALPSLAVGTGTLPDLPGGLLPGLETLPEGLAARESRAPPCRVAGPRSVRLPEDRATIGRGRRRSDPPSWVVGEAPQAFPGTGSVARVVRVSPGKPAAPRSRRRDTTGGGTVIPANQGIATAARGRGSGRVIRARRARYLALPALVLPRARAARRPWACRGCCCAARGSNGPADAGDGSQRRAGRSRRTEPSTIRQEKHMRTHMLALLAALLLLLGLGAGTAAADDPTQAVGPGGRQPAVGELRRERHAGRTPRTATSRCGSSARATAATSPRPTQPAPALGRQRQPDRPVRDPGPVRGRHAGGRSGRRPTTSPPARPPTEPRSSRRTRNLASGSTARATTAT